MLPVLPAAYPPIICDYIQLVCCGYLVNQTAKQVVQRVLLAVRNVGGNQALVCQSYYDQIFFWYSSRCCRYVVLLATNSPLHAYPSTTSTNMAQMRTTLVCSCLTECSKCPKRVLNCDSFHINCMCSTISHPCCFHTHICMDICHETAFLQEQ